MTKTVDIRHIVAGAIYDFAGRLTCRKEPITLGSVHNAAPAAEACQEFLKLRGCSDGEPLVREWTQHLGKPGVVDSALALGSLQHAMAEDYGYAWTWHCAMACAAGDEGLNHEAANRAASRLMQMAFHIDTSGGHPGKSAGQPVKEGGNEDDASW